MSSIDKLYPVLRAAIPTYSGFSTKKEILNPYSLVDNPRTFLEDSWGIKILASSRANSDLPAGVKDYSITTIRQIGVVLSRAVYDVQGIGHVMNEQATSMLGDASTIRDNFLNLSKFGVLLGGEEVEYEGDSGLETLSFGDGSKFIYTEINFTFELTERIN